MSAVLRGLAALPMVLLLGATAATRADDPPSAAPGAAPPTPAEPTAPLPIATPLPADPVLRAVVEAIEARYCGARSYRDRAMIRTRIDGDPAPLGGLAEALQATDQIVDLEWNGPEHMRLVAPRAVIELRGEVLHVEPKTGPVRTLAFPRPGGAAAVVSDPHATVLTEHPIVTLLLGDATAPQSAIAALRRIERVEPIPETDRRHVFGSIPVDPGLAERLGVSAALPVRFEVTANDEIVKVEIDTSGYFHPMARRVNKLGDDVALPRIATEIVLRDVRLVPAPRE